MKHISLSLVLCLTTVMVKAQGHGSYFQPRSESINKSENKIKSTLTQFSSAPEISQDERSKYFIAYELGEAVFNKFQSISGEIGIRFKNQKLLRLVHVNLNLTEGHLSSGFAGAVDGNNVEGKQFGFEVFYDFPVILKGLYFSPSVAHYNTRYQHTILDERIQNSSVSLGAAISFRETDIFNIKGLYYSASIPMRINLNPLEETRLGNAIVVNNTFDNNIWFFIGYEF